MLLKGILHVPRWLHRPNSLLLRALQILPIGPRATPLTQAFFPKILFPKAK